MTRFLASVRNLSEADIVLEHGADIVDLKEPARGALGAVDVFTLKQVVQRVAGRSPISATIGDIPIDADMIRNAASQRFEAGAEYVKVGLFPGRNVAGMVSTLSQELGAGHALVAVLFADLDPQLRILPLLADCGFAGVMLDTAKKASGSLCDHASGNCLTEFIKSSHELGMFCGLAGSLDRDDVSRLLPLRPDYLGFRGALCRAGRTTTIDASLVREMRALVKGSWSNAPVLRQSVSPPGCTGK